MQSVQSRIIAALLRAVFHSPLSDSRKLSDNAAKITKDKKSRYRPSKNFEHSRHKCGDTAYEKLISRKSRSEKVILLIHGGGFKVSLIDYYRKLAEKLCRMLGCATVINTDYRTYPAHPLPTQMHDVADIYIELINQGTKPENIAFIGDSAGATLALTSSLWLRDNGYPLPSAIVCFSLWGDATSSGASRIKNAYSDPFYGISKGKKIEDNLHLLRRISAYVQDVDRTDPYISPCFGSFEGFPPVTLICGTAELDESDNDTVFEKLKQAKTDAELHKFEGMWHCFQMFSFLPESRRAYKIVKNRLSGGN